MEIVSEKFICTVLVRLLSCRFKDVADSASENKKGGAYSQEVDNILHRKAHAITNCYLNSPVPPKIQVRLT